MRARTLILLFLAIALAGGTAMLALSWLRAQRSSEIAEAPPPPPPPGPLPAPSALDAALAKLISGNIAFNTPDSMTVGKSKIIEAKLSINLPVDDLIKQLTEVGKKESGSLQVADRMSVTLSGAGAFDVSPSGAQLQFISRQQVTTWTWEVTPKQTGKQFLILSFDVVLTIDGKDGTRNVNTFKRPIEVEVAWPETPGEWLEWFKNLFENLSWLWATVLLPVGLWIWNRFRKKRNCSPGVTAWLDSGPGAGWHNMLT